MISVVDGGFQTLVVDLGREFMGKNDMGLSPSGPMDSFSFRVGNILLGNDENAAGLECCYVGPTLEVMDDTCIAFTGAEVDPMINGKEVPMWQVHRVKSGDVISFGYLKSGSYFYICFSGGIDVPIVFGSRSTYMTAHIGGYEGRPLKQQDVVKLFPPYTHLSRVVGRRLEDKYVPQFSNYNEVRMVLGLEQHCIANLDELSEAIFVLSPLCGRMANRFYCPEFEYKWTKDIRNEPQPFGAGQDRCNAVDNPYPIGDIQTDMRSGAIVLLQDQVTEGGYVSFAKVIDCDLDVVGQAKPGDKVKFVPISLDQALSIRKGKRIQLNRVRESCLI